ncbi:unnamed protein product, partial [Mesorhabditis spiculigera]
MPPKGKGGTPRTKTSKGAEKKPVTRKQSSTDTCAPKTLPTQTLTRTKSFFNLAIQPEYQALVTQFVIMTLDKTMLQLRTEFSIHKRVADKADTVAFLQNQPKNRYKDVPCLDNCRVKLTGVENDYIHANYVSTPKSDKRFICCQAPITETQADHWRMVVQEKVEHMLMLCNFIEAKPKCTEYFPTPAVREKTFGPFTITLISCDKIKWEGTSTAVVMMSTLEIKKDGVKVHECTHYHWIDWPDRGVPKPDLAPFELLSRMAGSTMPILIHCSAGIGRTGALVLLQYTLEAMNKGQQVKSMADFLLKVREQRANSVQTDAQYVYVHMMLLNYFQKEGLIADRTLQKKFKDHFAPNYHKFAEAAETKLDDKPKKK